MFINWVTIALVYQIKLNYCIIMVTDELYIYILNFTVEFVTITIVVFLVNLGQPLLDILVLSSFAINVNTLILLS